MSRCSSETASSYNWLVHVNGEIAREGGPPKIVVGQIYTVEKTILKDALCRPILITMP